MTWSSLRR